ncbi:MAG TPA: molybdate ABC transporter substrate-binding protein [Thermodesulfobacteriota bacterium]|nr:molybdate ABC transporter substrate-binding protein [Thermodesulfobacteriota bacterium]
MHKKLFLIFLFTVVIVKTSSASEILVSAASDLTGAFKEIGALYEKESGNRVVFNFGSTGMLAQQIEGGAPIDLFAAANRKYIDDLERKGLIIPETKRVYAVGRIVLATPKGGAKLNSLKDLLRPEIKMIAIANPSHAPYGMAANEAMEKEGVWHNVKDKLVYGENIRQVMQYLETRNVDAAVVALSLLKGSDLSFTLIPLEIYSPIEQTLAVMKGAKNGNEARELADFISGPKGRAVLERYGFEMPVKR